ncbi:glycosyltransferase [Geobacillus sp. C56-T2]|uniref:glycosyltransferase n=1 Tax=Geobacillus sp. C56-T2 TaxID=600773 RepID=UPI00119E3289|nr:glycosyltransferase [Geobacillus sp. C56-T2]NNV07973.1 glycosyltransferase [Geobacillus sp. MMMUD3]TWG31878.1 glycosyltransferase involved in cell wall biosynthesis [Geobacillus sp. C56-T2]
MKIAQVFPYYGLNGLTRYVTTLNEGLLSINKDIEIVNFVVVDNDRINDLERMCISNERIQYYPIKRDLSVSLNRKSLLDDCSIKQIELEFEKFLERYKPDVVNFQHLSDMGASLIGIAKDKGIPTILTLHDYWIICPLKFLMNRHFHLCSGPNLGAKCVECFCDFRENDEIRKKLLQESLLRFSYIKDTLKQKTDLIIAVSKSVQTKLLEEGINPKKIKVIYPALKTKTQITKKDYLNKRIVFGFIGGLYIIKGPHVLIDAFNSLQENNTELHIYGDSSSQFRREVLEKMVNSDKVVKFKGKYTPEDLDSIFSTIDVLVVPSVCPETGPLVVQESLRYRVPVIASNIGGIPEYVRNEYGALFEPGNSKELANIMTTIIKQPSIVQKWVDNIPQFPSVERFVEEVQNIYLEVLKLRKDSVRYNHMNLLNRVDRSFIRREAIRESLPIQINFILDYLINKNYNRIAIFGAGELGRKVANDLKKIGIDVSCFIDNDVKKQNKFIDGIKIIHPNIIKCVKPKAILIVSDWEFEIMSQLQNMNLDIPILGLYSFENIE